MVTAGRCVRVYLMFFLLTLVSSCSNRSIYEGLQASNRFDCGRLPVQQREECMKRASKSYDQYERERQSL